MIGSDPEGRLGEAPRPELREQGRISGACFDAARGIIPGLKVLKSLMKIFGDILRISYRKVKKKKKRKTGVGSW